MYRLSVRLHALTVFRELLEDPVVGAVLAYLDGGSGPAGDAAARYAAIAAALYRAGTTDLTGYIQDLTLSSETPCVRLSAAGKPIPPEMERAFREDVRVLQDVSALTPDVLREGMDWTGYLPGWEAGQLDLLDACRRRMENVSRCGWGMYARYHVFSVDGKGGIVPVAHPDGVRLEDLAGYSREKKLVLDNSLALLEGKPAANVLLTGDAGTGKSSTVKAVANELRQGGLRILEVRKEQLHLLPVILEELTENPLKFILFIDDLSFAKNDGDFNALKAILEGSVSAKAPNTVIYATSNRRHLIKEHFSDRQGDDVHVNDTMQEIVSLSDRFGLHVTFQKPDKAAYLDIVRRLAAQRSLAISDDALCAGAERFALTRTRSPRAARQYVDRLAAGTL